MTDLLRYYRLEDNLGVTFYRGVDDDERMEVLMGGVWEASCLSRTYLEFGNGLDWTFEEISSVELWSR